MRLGDWSFHRVEDEPLFPRQAARDGGKKNQRVHHLKRDRYIYLIDNKLDRIAVSRSALEWVTKESPQIKHPLSSVMVIVFVHEVTVVYVCSIRASY